METQDQTPRHVSKARPRRILSYAILGGATLTLAAAVAATRPQRAPVPPPTGVLMPAPRAAEPPEPMVEGPVISRPARPQVELVFALDTTSSMTGLIEGAKQKIWSIARFVAQGQPTPDLRIGLVAYRDIGDDYVTKVFDLDADLDRVYRRLRDLRAEGGGDTPEHVARALDESVRKISWSRNASVVKVLYLVGDAPPHTDYQDGYDYVRSARVAHAKGIALHTIECGNDPETETVWRRIAALGGGQFMAIRQDGGMAEEHTRYDDELATLHDRLSRTSIFYGAGGHAAAAVASEAAAAPAPVKADRAAFMAIKKKGSGGGKWDLVESMASGAVKLDDVQGDLPAELRGKDRTEQAAVVAAKQKEREELSQQIDKLSKLRQAEIAARPSAKDGFDKAAEDSLRKSVTANAHAGFKL